MEEEYCDSPDEHYQQDKSTASNTGSTPREHISKFRQESWPFLGGVEIWPNPVFQCWLMFELLLWISQNFRYILGPDKFPFVFWVFQFLYHTIQASSFFFGLHLESFYFGEVEFLGILFIFIYLFIYLFFWWGRVILESFFLEGDS